MTECIKCGDCCENIRLMFSKKDLREMKSRGDNPGNASFVLKYWKRIRRPKGEKPGGYYYECTKFDPEARLCTAHDERPPVCRDYPWYGREPRANAGLPNQCSFWADVPEEDRPVFVELKAKAVV